MALTELQKTILRNLASNRSESSYVAGGLVLNKDWPRGSDDIDIFHDSDEDVTDSAKRDIETLTKAGFKVSIEVMTYGCVEATVSDGSSSTVIQWFGETRRRFFPLVKDNDWGARLHQADLAVNKVLAATGRSKARDIADLIAIAEHYCPLGPLVMAAAGKPPNFSPQKMLDEIRRHVFSIPAEDFASIKGLPLDWTAELIRTEAIKILDAAEKYIMTAPIGAIGLLAVDGNGIPKEVTDATLPSAILRKATEESEAMPSLPEFNASGWDTVRP